MRKARLVVSMKEYAMAATVLFVEVILVEGGKAWEVERKKGGNAEKGLELYTEPLQSWQPRQ